jgi:hypothetical protein
MTSSYESVHIDYFILKLLWATDFHTRSVTGFSPRRPAFVPRSVSVEFVGDRVALQAVFLRVLRFSLSISFHRSSIFTHISLGQCTVGPLAAAVPQRHDDHHHHHVDDLILRP